MSVMRWHCCIVECVLRNPNWWKGIQFCRFVSLYILLNRSFPVFFIKLAKCQLVCTILRLLGFFPGFWIVMIFACFKGAGQYFSLGITLKIYRRFWYSSWGISCRIWAVIRSKSGALCGCSIMMTRVSSWRVNTCIFSVGWVWAAISLSTSRFGKLCGVNTSAYWFANNSTFFSVAFGPGPRRCGNFTDWGERCLWFFLCFNWLPDGIVVRLRVETYFVKESLLRLRRAVFSLLLALL